jgi:hypothetical protein
MRWRRIFSIAARCFPRIVQSAAFSASSSRRRACSRSTCAAETACWTPGLLARNFARQRRCRSVALIAFLPMGGRPKPAAPDFLSTTICRRKSGAVNEPAPTDLDLCRVLGSCYSESIRAGYPCRPVSSGCAKSPDRSSEPPRRALLRLIKRARPSERHSRRLIGCGQRLFARANVTPEPCRRCRLGPLSQGYRFA